MALQREYRKYQPRPQSHRSALVVIAGTMSVLLVACGSSGGAATAVPALTVAPTVGLAVASPPATNTQAAATPTIAPAATGRAAVTPTAPTTAPSANTGAAKSNVDPGLLVTKADYLAVMGDAANDPEKKTMTIVPGFAQSSYDYKIASGDKVQFVTLYVTQRDGSVASSTRPGLPTTMSEYWAFTKKGWAAAQEKATPAPDIGPEVFLVDNPLLDQAGAGNQVQFFKNDVVFSVQAFTGSGTVDEQNAAGTVAAKKLAALAFGRL